MIPVNTGTIVVFKRWKKECLKRNAKATGGTGTFHVVLFNMYMYMCIYFLVH